MGKIVDCATRNDSSDPEGSTGTMPDLGMGLEFSSDPGCAKPTEGSLAGSSSSHLKSYFVGMGFTPTLVQKVIEENDEQDVDLLLETLFTYSALQKSSSESPDCVDGVVTPKAESSSSVDFSSCSSQEIEELDVSHANINKKDSLLMMNFSEEEVDLAIEKLGENAPVNELVDFIIAAQTAGSSGEKNADDPVHDYDAKVITTETLFSTMDKTLRLLEMGFSEDDIAFAMDKFGAEVPVLELADSIFANQIANTHVQEDKDPSNFKSHRSWKQNNSKSLHSASEERMKRCFSVTHAEETEASGSNFPRVKDKDFKKMEKGKKAKYMPSDQKFASFETPRPEARTVDIDSKKMKTGKSAKYMPIDDKFASFGSPKLEAEMFEEQATGHPMIYPYRVGPESSEVGQNVSEIPNQPMPNVCRNVRQVGTTPPYFFYGNVVDISHETWSKISQFLYGGQPEFVNSQFFSAFIRKEGYIHNLPTDNRSHILPRPPMTIEDAIPHTKKWWPSWDTRKQLSYIRSETMGLDRICERLGKILMESQGMLSKEQQMDIFHQCKTLNLVWVGHYRLRPIEPDQVEHILGYPLHHTRIGDHHPAERLRLLKNSFQTDTLGYYLSALKGIFPDGLTVLSMFSGIGGAEVALHRLGLSLKCVVAVETSKTNREILKKWWSDTRQAGELRLISDIQKLTSYKIESLIKELGGFDVVIGGSPCTHADGENPVGLDLSQFYEFVRVLQSVRGTMGRNR
ncbi:putative inactive DNA (cytosine-5)-methyltransferase DRM3 isoform X2 [Tasmannia lanceolata]|uniref:putative inactive DNA (cytosine-5)-methyltransferase DRM3 isoform X2 n=1 Tax=Tasmannia lanceolata TaxID=3420 RepID=UPI0040641220